MLKSEKLILQISFLLVAIYAIYCFIPMRNKTSGTVQNNSQNTIVDIASDADDKIERKNLGSGFFEIKYKERTFLYHQIKDYNGSCESVIEIKSTTSA